jgi:hypothetical protein
MHDLTEEDISTVSRLISEERLSTFRNMTSTTRAAIALHQQTLQVAGALMSVTAMVETALRNAVCERLSEHFGVEGWLRRPPAPFTWKDEERSKIEAAVRGAQRAVYTRLDAPGKRALDATAFRRGVPQNLRHEFRSEARRKAIAVRSGQIVSQLTLYFWKRLFSRDYEQTLWKSTLKRIFPSKRIDRSAVAAQLERIYQARNRIAHHEPVYGHRLTDALNAVDFIAANLGQQGDDGSTALRKMLCMDRAALESRAHLLQSGMSARSASTHAGIDPSRHRHVSTDAVPLALKPRSPDPQHS